MPGGTGRWPIAQWLVSHAVRLKAARRGDNVRREIWSMSEELTLHIKNTIAAVHSANEAASRWLEEHGTPADVQYFANLAIEELATNCIKYGYDDTDEHVIEVSVSLSCGSLVLVVKDDGHPFNPLAVPTPHLSLPVEEWPIGGLGIHLLRQMSDRLEYVREDGKNRVTLRKTTAGWARETREEVVAKEISGTAEGMCDVAGNQHISWQR
jgi:serine/threonine-protein kinase RsbW